MKRITVLLAICFSVAKIQAQIISPSIIASAGDFYSTSAVTLSFTEGVVIDEFLTSSLLTSVKNETLVSNTIVIYPNPATSQLTIRTSSFHNEAVMVSVVNVLGQIVQEEKLMWSNDISMNIKNLSAGMYFLQIKTENGSVVKRFVKE